MFSIFICPEFIGEHLGGEGVGDGAAVVMDDWMTPDGWSVGLKSDGCQNPCLVLLLRQTSLYLPNFPSHLSLHWCDGGKRRKEEIRGIGLFLHHRLRFSVQVKKMRPGPSEACSTSCLSQTLFSLPAQVRLWEKAQAHLQARDFPSLNF